MFYDIFDSPLGALTVSTDGTYLTGLHIEGDRYFTHVPVDWVRSTTQPLLRQVHRELTEYFGGIRTTFDIPVLTGGTEFQQTVWKALRLIPSGTTTTYRTIAEMIGKPKAARAVGTAVGHNPICIIIPCHRVLASDGTLGGFVAGLPCKQQLLDIEGY